MKWMNEWIYHSDWLFLILQNTRVNTATLATRSPSSEICFCTLWNCDLDLWFFDLPVASLVIVVSAVLVLSCGQTHRRTDRQTRMNALLPQLSSAWVMNRFNTRSWLTHMPRIIYRPTKFDVKSYKDVVKCVSVRNACVCHLTWSYTILWNLGLGPDGKQYDGFTVLLIWRLPVTVHECDTGRL